MAGDLVLGWAWELDADRLAAFIEDLWGAAGGPNDLNTLDAIEAVIAKHRPDDTSPPPAGECIGSPLTHRQTEVLTQLANGVMRRDIGEELGISRGVLRNLLSSAYQRLGARTEAHAVAIAQQHGWLAGPDPQRGAPGERPRGHSPQQWRAIHLEWVAQMRRQPGTSVAIGPYISRANTRPIIQRLTTGAIDGSAPGSFAAHPVVTGPSRVMVHGRYLGDPATRDTARTPDEGARP
jgi:DNA-binding CsgD family transcriptional regulator